MLGPFPRAKKPFVAAMLQIQRSFWYHFSKGLDTLQVGYALARIQQSCAAVEIIIEFFVLGVEKIHDRINEENISIFPWAGVGSWNLPGRFIY